MSSKQFEEALSLGMEGEDIVDKIFKDAGWVIYHPKENASHPIDRIAIQPYQSKLLQTNQDRKGNITPPRGMVIFWDVKLKPRRLMYSDTGVDKDQYEIYKTVDKYYGGSMMLFFIDPETQQIYGNSLSNLDAPCIYKSTDMSGNITSHNKHYPSNEGGIIYFPLQNMKLYKYLTPAACNHFREQNKRNGEYSKLYEQVDIKRYHKEYDPLRTETPQVKQTRLDI